MTQHALTSNSTD